MESYDRIKLSRDAARPTSLDYIASIFTDFTELHGDRALGDDRAVIGGIGWLSDLPVTVIAIEKGHSVEERVYRRFGCPVPEGYRKALRLMKEAEKFHRPVLCLIDTQGAYPGVEAEIRGIGHSIAENLYECMTLKTPILSIVVGEGGSGGALALGVADEVWMLSNAYYSVITPEACANVLYKDHAAEKYEEVTEHLGLFAENLQKYGMIEHVIKEPADFSVKNDITEFMQALKERILQKMTELNALSAEDLLEMRYGRFRKYRVVETTEGGYKMADFTTLEQ